MGKRSYITWVLKLCIFICILALFAIIFLKDYLTNYLDGKTTFSSNYEDVLVLEFPTIIVCVKSGFKDEVMKKHGFESVYNFPGKNPENVSEMFDEVSFIYGVDYEIEITSPISFKREDILTFRHGKCHKMQPKEEIVVTQRVSLDLTWKNLDLKPKEIILYLFSNESWHGICDDVLPYFQPSAVTLNLEKPGRLNIPISMTSYEYMEGKNFEYCIKSIVDTLNCSVQCMPFYLVSTTPLSICDTKDTSMCIESGLYTNRTNVGKTYGCHKPKHAKLFNPRPILWNKPFEANSSMIYFYFESLSVLHKEEIFVIDDLEFVGSVGGSLGLFVGFSFYSYITDFVQMIVERFCHK